LTAKGCVLGCKLPFLWGVFSLFWGADEPKTGRILVKKGKK